MEERLADIISAVANSRRYRHVAPEVIARLAREEIPKSKNQADAQKRTQRRLHQIFGAYHTPLVYDRLLANLRAARPDPGAFKNTCKHILQSHASTAERLPDLDSFYRRIFEITGPPARLLDLACGLNPLALPWMNLPLAATYLAADIDLEMIRFLNAFFEISNSHPLTLPPPVAAQAIIHDLISGPPAAAPFDVALVLKTVACLQHQTHNVAPLLEQIPARHLVISFPTKSLGKIPKGMPQTYRTLFHQIASLRHWDFTELTFPSELVFIVTRNHFR